MSKDIATIRELNASELDLVGGGLSVGASAGVSVDALPEFNAVHGAIGGALDRLGITAANGGLLGTVLGAVGGATKG